MKKNEIELSKRDKIITVLYQMSGGKKTTLKYEDIVVMLFKKYPADFHLKGYPEYPDAASHQSFIAFVKKDLFKFVVNLWH